MQMCPGYNLGRFLSLLSLHHAQNLVIFTRIKVFFIPPRNFPLHFNTLIQVNIRHFLGALKILSFTCKKVSSSNRLFSETRNDKIINYDLVISCPSSIQERSQNIFTVIPSTFTVMFLEAFLQKREILTSKR